MSKIALKIPENIPVTLSKHQMALVEQYIAAHGSLSLEAIDHDIATIQQREKSLSEKIKNRSEAEGVDIRVINECKRTIGKKETDIQNQLTKITELRKKLSEITDSQRQLVAVTDLEQELADLADMQKKLAEVSPLHKQLAAMKIEVRVDENVLIDQYLNEQLEKTREEIKDALQVRQIFIDIYPEAKTSPRMSRSELEQSPSRYNLAKSKSTSALNSPRIGSPRFSHSAKSTIKKETK